MRKKNVIRLLRNADDKMTEQISRDYPGMTDAEREVLFQRIEQQLAAQRWEAAEEEAFPVIEERRFPRMFQTAAAAVCMLAMCGTFAGLFWMKGQMQNTEQTEATDVSAPQVKLGHSMGERYAAENLTQSGTLWMTVTETEAEGELFRVSVTLESHQAVSLADNAMGEPYLFMADNFMAATGQNGENWITVQPCKSLQLETKEGQPYPIRLFFGESCELELWFKRNDLPEEWKLVTNYSTAYPYTVISMKEE